MALFIVATVVEVLLLYGIHSRALRKAHLRNSPIESRFLGSYVLMYVGLGVLFEGVDIGTTPGVLSPSAPGYIGPGFWSLLLAAIVLGFVGASLVWIGYHVLLRNIERIRGGTIA